MHSFKRRGPSMSWTLLLTALTYTGVSSQQGWLKWEETVKRFAFDDDAVVCRNGDAVVCRNGDGIFIEDVTLLGKKSCPGSVETRLTDDVFKSAVRRDCSGRLKCRTRNVLDLLKKYKCDDGSRPITSIILTYHCKPFDLMQKSNVVLDMCKLFYKSISNHAVTNSLVLRSKMANYQRCVFNAHESNNNITLKTLQVDTGSQCDTMDDCEGFVDIYVDEVLRSRLKRRRRRRENVCQSEMLYKPGDDYDYVTTDKDAKDSSGAPPTSENGIYALAKQSLSAENRYHNVHGQRVGEMYSKVNKFRNAEAASAPSTVNGETNDVPNKATEVDEYSHLAHFKVETRITENVYDG